jgi:hypothetical protein
LPVVHVAPAVLQLIGLPQIMPPAGAPSGVQFAPQHCVLFVQAVPFVLQACASSVRPPSVITSMNASLALPSSEEDPSSSEEPSPVAPSSPGRLPSSVASSPASPLSSGLSVLPHAAVNRASRAAVEKSASAA